MDQEIRRIFKQARNDPELQNTLDIDALLSGTAEKTQKKIDQIVATEFPKYDPQECPRFLRDLGIAKHIAKLQEYCPIEELHELRNGQYVKWIPKDDLNVLKPGGTYIGVKFCNTGTLLVIRTFFGKNVRIFHLKFDNYYIFQKITEENILMSIV